MTDLSKEPALETKKPISRWVWWLCGILFAVLIALISIPGYGEPAKKDRKTANTSVVKGIFPALKMYGGDHDGQYPLSLMELEPDYLSSTGVEHTRYIDPDSSRRNDWFYVQGLSETSPAKWILLASPTEQIFKDSERRQRNVLYNDGTVDTVPSDKFNQMLAEQVKAMAAQGL